MINSADAKIQMTAEQIFKEIEALPESERERLVQQSADVPQDFIDAINTLNDAKPGMAAMPEPCTFTSDSCPLVSIRG
jgi:hypothetical protein